MHLQNSIEMPDINEFHECMNEQRHQQRILDLEQFGRKEIGVDATPSFFVFNDEEIIKIRGNQPVDVFRQVISELENNFVSNRYSRTLEFKSRLSIA